MTEPPAEYPPDERRAEAVTEVRRRPPGPPPWWREHWWIWGLVLLLLVALLIAFFFLREEDEEAADGRTVPSVIGLMEDEAVEVLEREGFEVEIDHEDSDAPAGEVFDQVPEAGSDLAEGETVNIDVSHGESETVTQTVTETETETTETEEEAGEIDEVPDVVGQDHVLAGLRVETEGFAADTYPVPSSDPAGTVVDQRPAGGTELREGETVRLNVSEGPDPPPDAEVPDVTGPAAGEARARCREARFTCRTVARDAPSEEEVGEVIDQQPAAGSTAPEFSQITLFVGR